MGAVMNAIGSRLWCACAWCYGRQAEALYTFHYLRARAWGTLAAVCFGAAVAVGLVAQRIGGVDA